MAYNVFEGSLSDGKSLVIGVVGVGSRWMQDRSFISRYTPENLPCTFLAHQRDAVDVLLSGKALLGTTPYLPIRFVTMSHWPM